MLITVEKYFILKMLITVEKIFQNNNKTILKGVKMILK